MMFWETLPGLIASWAAAVVGVGIIARAIWKTFSYGRKVATSVGRLIEIGDTDAWPNGSTSLPQSMTELYNRQSEGIELTKAAMNKTDLAAIRLEHYIVTHRADHGLLPPE